MESSEKIVMYPDNNNGLFGNNNGQGGGLIGFILGILFGNGGLWGNHNGSMMNAMVKLFLLKTLIIIVIKKFNSFFTS